MQESGSYKPEYTQEEQERIETLMGQMEHYEGLLKEAKEKGLQFMQRHYGQLVMYFSKELNAALDKTAINNH